MKKYLAKLMFNISIGEGNDATQFDEQIRLIESPNLEEAFHKARRIGKQEEEVFYNTAKESVAWQFIDVMELYALDNMPDGAQLYSNTHQTPDVGSFIKYVRQKSIEIQVKSLTFA